mmetsp:Transcript_148214/g.476059  ORF Transcript_148214/g.476059 Transcript_148214/m.476059 type:complete len:186 (-) Transcript_148214:254-811(-)
MCRFFACGVHTKQSAQRDEPQSPGQVPDPLSCSDSVAIAVSLLVSVVDDLLIAWQDCTIPTLELDNEELACTTDIIAFIKDASEMSAEISSATLSCGGLDSSCAASVLQTLKSLAEGSEVCACVVRSLGVLLVGFGGVWRSWWQLPWIARPTRSSARWTSPKQSAITTKWCSRCSQRSTTATQPS